MGKSATETMGRKAAPGRAARGAGRDSGQPEPRFKQVDSSRLHETLEKHRAKHQPVLDYLKDK